MYRNCPEHTVTREILENGEPTDICRSGRCSIFDYGSGFVAEEEQIFCISEKDFAEICFERKIKNDCHK